MWTPKERSEDAWYVPQDVFVTTLPTFVSSRINPREYFAPWCRTTWTTGVLYLGVTHAVLITLQIDRVQDDLGGLLRLARLWDGIGAQNFVSAFGRVGILRFGVFVYDIGIWRCGCWMGSKQTKRNHHSRLETYHTWFSLLQNREYVYRGWIQKRGYEYGILRRYFN